MQWIIFSLLIPYRDPRGDAGGLGRENVLRIPSVS